MDNKGQVTIFVIVGVILVAIVSIMFFANRNGVTSGEVDFDNPESYIDDCIKESSAITIDKILLGGGVMESNNTIQYNGAEVTYLCNNINYFGHCVNQYPLYLSRVEREIENEMIADTRQCLAILKQEFERRNYELEASEAIVDAEIKPGVIDVKIYSNVSITKDQVTKTFSKFQAGIPSRLYDIAFVANEIVTQEAKQCYFDEDNFMSLYPDYDIRVKMLDDTTEIYTIEDKRSKEKMIMAVRGCAKPAGLL